MTVVLTEGTDYVIKSVLPSSSINKVVIQTINTVDGTDTIAITLNKYGIGPKGFIGALGFRHTTDNSVVVQEQPTTSVSSGVLTLTVGATAGVVNDPRIYVLYGTSLNP